MSGSIANFFAREDINTSRQKNIDYAKAISIVFMVFIHVLMHPEYQGLHTTIFGRIADLYLGCFMAAPVFMTAMGVGLAFTRNSNPNQIIKRGVKFFLGSFLLNIVRSFSIIIYNLAVQRDHLATRLIHSIFNGDILSFVGLALILFGLLKKIKHHEIIIPSLALIFTIIVTVVPAVYTENTAISMTLGHFFPIGGGFFEIDVHFPLMSWFIFVAFGYSFALIMRKIKNLDRFYLWSMIIGLALLIPIVTTEVIFNYGEMRWDAPEVDIYMTTLPDAVLSIGFVLFDFGAFHFITKITSEKINHFFFRMSDAINEIYIISWVLILNIDNMVLTYVIKKEPYEVWVYMVAFILVMTVSLILGLYWKKWKRSRKSLKSC